MSKIRPEVSTAARGTPCPSYPDALWMIRDSVRRRDGLLYGHLHDKARGAHCAIGSFFDDNPKMALGTDVIDEVASYNDSIPPTVSEKTRKRKVLEFLNFKIRTLAGGKR